ncbi:hypothetical protein J31TS4_13170 [Paenibacillus sp. J31TS4]|uniref:glutaredoxin family protein n=1 Tax=Paenibacillus sp. J31TS4 TaxID=2807195 RepID=UPI001B2DDE0A|nr:glutaredoxin family protein [Paenibacillus sp. J31TS4]GIP38037.1 hypothetical protein J31TS4_13170 [Paenibacillus sp. J31TS4]
MSETQEVTVYSRNHCPYCDQVKKYLQTNNIEYVEKNVELNEAFAEELWNMGMQSVPVTVIGENKILGMNVTKFKQVLNL